MDHAEYGYRYLFLEHHIEDFGINEESTEAIIIGKSILNHSKYKIDTNLTRRELLFTTKTYIDSFNYFSSNIFIFDL